MAIYEINIARAHTLEDWQGVPAHTFMGRVELVDTMSYDLAKAELRRLAEVYPYPAYCLTLTARKQEVTRTRLVTTMTQEHLAKKHWNGVTLD